MASVAGAALGALAWLPVRSWLGPGAFVVAIAPVWLLPLPVALMTRHRGRRSPIDAFPRMVAGQVGYFGGVGLALLSFGIFAGSDYELVFGTLVVSVGLVTFRFMQVRAQRPRN